MKIYVINDTSTYHSGCKAVVDYIKLKLTSQGHEIISMQNAYIDQISSEKIDECDALVCNGEGTLHHKKKHRIFDAIEEAQNKGKKTYLVNTVWDRNEGDWQEILSKLDGFIVREVLSQNQVIQEQKTRPIVLPDFSYFCPIDERSDFIDFKNEEVYGSDWFLPNPFKHDNIEWKDLNLRSGSWSYIVKSLKTARIYITGRHHGVYAACKAETLFVPYQHNCHKIEGIFKSAGVNIPISRSKFEVMDAISWAYENKHIYERLFKWMRSHKGWDGVK